MPVLLRTAARDVRASRSAMHLASDAVGFAMGMAKRFAPFAEWTSPASRDLAQSGPRVTRRIAHHHSHVHVAPRLELTVLRLAPPEKPAGREPAREQPPSRWETVRPDSVTTNRIVERVLRREVHRSVEWERIARQVVARTERVEQTRHSTMHISGERVIQNAPRSTPLPRIQADTEERVTRVYRTLPQHEEIEGTESPRERPRMGREPDESRTRPTGSPPESPNIDRIAEQVIRVIDRRIVAERERFGRP